MYIYDGEIIHYASPYYDPVKAREYYLQNRELKGRTAGNLKTEKKKIGWQYAKDQIDQQKQSEQDAAVAANTKALEDFKATAQEKRKAISDSLKQLLSSISTQAISEKERLSEELDKTLADIAAKAEAEIAALPALPKGLSKDRLAELSAERQQKIAEIRGTATLERSNTRKQFSNARKALNSDVTDTRAAIRENSAAQREQLASDLKNTVETARANYEKLKADIKAKYETIYQTEYDAIKSKV